MQAPNKFVVFHLVCAISSFLRWHKRICTGQPPPPSPSQNTHKNEAIMAVWDVAMDDNTTPLLHTRPFKYYPLGTFAFTLGVQNQAISLAVSCRFHQFITFLWPFQNIYHIPADVFPHPEGKNNIKDISCQVALRIQKSQDPSPQLGERILVALADVTSIQVVPWSPENICDKSQV